MSLVRVTYYLDVISSWCYWAEPAWAELKRRYADQGEFDWKIALVDATALPATAAQEEWFYQRSGTVVRSIHKLNAGWFEPGLSSLAPNCVAEAAKDFGIGDDRARLAIAHAALREGQKVNRWEVAAEAAAAATGLDAVALLARASTLGIEARCRLHTEEFHHLQIAQRPAFVFDSAIGDRAVLSGVWRLEPLVAVMESLRADALAYASFKAHFGEPPTA